MERFKIDTVNNTGKQQTLILMGNNPILNERQ